MTRYDFFRKRIAPIAFLVVVGLIAYDSCDKQERTKATIILDFGAAEHDVRDVEAEIWMNNAQVTQFHRIALEGGYIGPIKLVTSLPDKDGEIRIEIELTGAVHKAITRQIHVEEGATVMVPLERDLR